MEPPDPSFADEFSVSRQYAVLVFGVHRAAVSLPFQVYRLYMLVEVGLVAFSSACSSLRTKSQKKLSTAALRTFRRFFPAMFTAFRRLLLWGSVRRRLLASSVAILRSSQPPHEDPHTNPVLHAGAWSAVPVRSQWKA